MSCQTNGPGLTNCGASSESCCTSLEVPGGTYDRTYTNAGGGPVGAADPASVSAFRLDKYLVTVGRFRQFASAWGGVDGGAGYFPAAGSGKHTHLNGGKGLVNVGSDAGVEYETGWVASDDGNLAPTNANLSCMPPYSTWTNSAGSQESLPINCVNWYEAYAFCIWDGGFLPSEAEWAYVADGGNQQREYPWGSADPGTGSLYAINGCDYPNGSGTCTGVTNIAPVGVATLGAGLWGQLDLVGEVLVWTMDWYATYVDPCTDCAYLSSTGTRVVRSADYSNLFPAAALHPWGRGGSAPGSVPSAARSVITGFRCARTL